jgi:ribonuclease HII
MNAIFIAETRIPVLEAQAIIDTLQISIMNNLRLHHGILVGGVDEAGRGSIIGPLVVAGICLQESKIGRLSELGVRDSKALTPKARARLFGGIMKLADSVCIRKVNPVDVDSSVSLRGLNRLEAKVMATVINNIGAEEVYVDCCDVNPERYRDYIWQHLRCSPKVHSIHHADEINVVVSAASIIAKITRDEEIRHIRSRYRSIGSGYPSDNRTMRFIRGYVAKNGNAPEFARKSWKPLRLLLEHREQCKLKA